MFEMTSDQENADFPFVSGTDNASSSTQVTSVTTARLFNITVVVTLLLILLILVSASKQNAYITE